MVHGCIRGQAHLRVFAESVGGGRLARRITHVRSPCAETLKRAKPGGKMLPSLAGKDAHRYDIQRCIEFAGNTYARIRKLNAAEYSRDGERDSVRGI